MVTATQSWLIRDMEAFKFIGLVVSAYLVLFLAGIAISTFWEIYRHRNGFGLKYPRKGKSGELYYELRPRHQSTSMTSFQDALECVLARIAEELDSDVYFADLFVDGCCEGTLRVSLNDGVFHAPDSPIERVEFISVSQKVTMKKAERDTEETLPDEITVGREPKKLQRIAEEITEVKKAEEITKRAKEITEESRRNHRREPKE
ncbi:hypothetical protein DICA3_E27622 [Diutina catenulata]